MRIIRIFLVLILLLGAGGTAALYVAPVPVTHFLLDMERSVSGLERKQVRLDDGTEYVFLEGGSGEPLVLLHGFGADKDHFTRVSRYFTDHYRVIIPDHMGFGESSRPLPADYTAPAQAQRLHELLQKLDVTTLHMGGNSMGAHIAVTFAYQYPDAVKSLWLLDSGGLWSAPGNDFMAQVQASGRNPLLASSTEEFARVADYAMSDPPFVPRPMLDVIAQDRIRNYDLEQEIFRQVSSDSLEPRAAAVRVPTLIVWGKEDKLVTPAVGEFLQRLMPQSRLIIMDGVGHLPMLEQPAQTARDYLAFRAGL